MNVLERAKSVIDQMHGGTREEKLVADAIVAAVVEEREALLEAVKRERACAKLEIEWDAGYRRACANIINIIEERAK